jgi:hypothetical protein
LRACRISDLNNLGQQRWTIRGIETATYWAASLDKLRAKAGSTPQHFVTDFCDSKFLKSSKFEF